MRITGKIYIMILVACLGMAGCHETTVGYLRTEHANYGVDSLHVGVESIYNRIAEMEKEYPPLKGWVETNNRVEELIAETSELYEEMENLDGDDPRLDEIWDRLDELNMLIDEGYYELYDYEYEFAEMGIDGKGLEILRDQYMSLFSSIELGLPWTTAMIEGILGTQPISFSIASITAEDGGDADMFRNELVIFGGGRMQLPFECKSPKGTYRVSILVENEGYSSTLENIFTFIID